MATLVLVRHGTSIYNAEGLWTGWTDIDLSEKGREEAREAGESIKDIHFDVAFTSSLIRAQHTLDEILQIIGQTDIQVFKDHALDEKSYGDLTGKNKWEVKEKYGEEQWMQWRRSWDAPIPHGETLKMVYERTVPYYEQTILPHLEKGENVLVCAHGNSLRALVKYLEEISDADIEKLEFGLGEVYVYTVDAEGNIVSKEIRSVKEDKGRI